MKKFVLSFLLLLLPASVSAHPGFHGHGFISGLAHPFLGADHISMMIGVGALAIFIGGRALWQLPLGFIFTMLVGASLASFGFALGFVEVMIAASVLTMGLMLLFANKLEPIIKLVTAVVMIFAIFHGYAHAAEMQASSSASQYFVGFIISTFILHVIGVLSGKFLIKCKLDKLAFNLVGSVMAMFGSMLLVF
ncbi:MAG: HupE/UreJ family protein [Psychromonas sp.]